MTQLIGTTMSAAFAAAGYKPAPTPAETLATMMREAIAKSGGNAERSLDSFVVALTKADDAALLWELFAPARGVILRNLFTETLVKMRAECALPNAGEATRGKPQGRGSTAEPATKPEGAATTEVPQGRSRFAAPSVPHAGAGARVPLPRGQNQRAPAPARQSRLRFGARDQVAKASILRTFRINGQPLAEITGAEARAWLNTHQRDCRFVSLVTHNVPDEIKIGAMVPEEEAERLYRLATEAGNA